MLDKKFTTASNPCSTLKTIDMKRTFYYLLIATVALCSIYYIYTTVTDFSHLSIRKNNSQCDIQQLRKQLAHQLAEIKHQLDEAVSNDRPPELNTLNDFDDILRRVDPIYTITNPNVNTAPDVCPEIFTKNNEWIRSCGQQKPIDTLLTILLYPAPSLFDQEKCSTYVSRIVSNVKQLYPKIHIIIAYRHSECYVSGKTHNRVQIVNFGTKTSDAAVFNYLISNYVNTNYTFIGRDLNHLDRQSNFERQIGVFGIDPRVKVVGGASRNTSGHWTVGCYQSEMNNYVLEYKSGYHSSKNECMFCDYILSPFISKTDFLKEIPFDENLPNEVVYQDFFIRVRNSGNFVLNCPDAMHFSNAVQSSVKYHWQHIAKKWQLNYIILPPKTKLGFSCSEIGISCVNTDNVAKTHLLPRCCIADFAKAFTFLQRMAEEHGFALEIDTGTVMGAVKMQGVLPWDIDGDVDYLSSQHNLIAGLKSTFRRNGFRLQIIDDAIYSTSNFKWEHGYMILWTPDQFIELFGMEYLSNRLLPPEIMNVSTKTELNGVWMTSPANPGLYVRNRYDAECLQHANHWRHTGKIDSGYTYKSGVFNSCSKRGHHACAERFLADGNIQFTTL